jgi:hypothetical protein
MHAILTEVPYLTRCQGPLASVIMGLLNVTPQARLSTQQVRSLLGQVVPAAPDHTTMYTPPHTTRPSPGRRRARWPWVAAVVVLLAAAFAGGWFSGRVGLVEPVVDAAKGPTYTYGDAGAQIPEFKLYQAGCAPARLEAGRSYTDNVDCAGPHDFEVLYALDPFGSDEIGYPDVAELRNLAEASCSLVFNLDEAIPEKERAELMHASLVPGEKSWNAPSSERDRRMYCLISRRDGKQLTQQVVPEN